MRTFSDHSAGDSSVQEFFPRWELLQILFPNLQVKYPFPTVGAENVYNAIVDKRVQIGRIKIAPDIVEKGLESCGEYKLRFAPVVASVSGSGEPDFGAVVMLRLVSGQISCLDLAPIVMEGDERFAI